MSKLKNSEKSLHLSCSKELGSLGSSKHTGGNFIDINKVEGHTHNLNFTFSTDLASVQSMNIVNGTSTKALDITRSTFKTIVGLNDKNVQSVLSVTQTSSDNTAVSTHIYVDKDGDGQYVESFDIHVEKTANVRHPQQKFTFNVDGTIASVMPVTNDHHLKPIGQASVLNKVTLNNVTYVTKTEVSTNQSEYHFNVFRDDNSDGTWTEIAHGETLVNNVDTTNGAINLVGIQSYLADASAIVG
jgi:hypothetical protein